MYSMQECCEKTGLTYDTLKYYCNQGLIPNVKRNKQNNYREFDDENVNWIKGLICLKKCDFSLKEIKEYIALCLEGESTIPQRKQMLLCQRKEIENQIQALNETLSFIDWKTKYYDNLLAKQEDNNK